MKKFAVVALVAALASSCGVNPETATRALKAQGMKDISINSYSLFGCGKEDTFSSNFTATGADGTRVSGVVCQGMFKGTTVRYD